MPSGSDPEKHQTVEWTLANSSSPMSAANSNAKRPPFTTSDSSRAKNSVSNTKTLVEPDLPRPVQDSSQPSGRTKKKVQFGSPWSRLWYELKQVIGPGSAPSSICDDPSSIHSTHPHPFDQQRKSLEDVEQASGDAENVRVVVDRFWTGSNVPEEVSSATNDDATPDMSGTSPAKRRVWDDSDVANAGLLQRMWFVIRWQLWASVLDFFFPKGYSSKEAEQHYLQEDWFVSKPLAVFSSLWFIFNWVLGISFFPPPFQRIDYVFFCAVGPAFSFPIFFMVIFNWPRSRPLIYQIVLTISVWMWSFYFVLFIYLCGQYERVEPRKHTFFACNGRDFIGLFYYATSLQTIALFGLKMGRFAAALGASAFFIFSCAAIIPDRVTWARTMINFFVYHVFLIFVHYVRENAERRLHHLRSQVKMQYRATQRAQRSERKMADSKYRLTSYVFHEVRVPLNAAAIALQNMAASGTIVQEMELEFSALSGSLQTMSQVLNDVLDFNRIDGGYFESVSKQFLFHKAMRTLFKTVEVMTVARGLDFTVNLDPEIDKAARRASYKAMGQSEDAIAQYIKETPDMEGVVVGDEARLRQIIHNLASNACKFTQPGGKVAITTKLMTTTHGTDDLHPEVVDVPTTGHQKDKLSATNLSLHNGNSESSAPSIIVRIEVSDTGCGIGKKESRNLFSPFHQTEEGRTQGGYGSGLGLSLVRSIVKLLGGRLGFSSAKGIGSNFWVELPLAVGQELTSETLDAGLDLDYLMAGRTMSPPAGAQNRERLAMPVDAIALQASATSNSVSNLGNGKSEYAQSRQSSLDTSGFGVGRSSPPSPRSARGSMRPVISKGESMTSIQLPNPGRTMTVAMPNPSPFALDPHPTNSTGISSFSSNNSNPMAVFDRAFGGASSSNRDTEDSPVPKDLHVLVVDDDYVTRSMMGRLLERLGCKVALAENGKVAASMVLGSGFTPSIDEAASTYFQPTKPPLATHDSDETETENAATSPPSNPVVHPRSESANSVPSSPRSSSLTSYDLVFLDNQMPVMSGLQAIRLLRTLGRKDFVVGLTGNALLPDQKEYIDAGVDHVLTKPVNKKELEDILKLAESRRRRTSRVSPEHQP